MNDCHIFLIPSDIINVIINEIDTKDKIYFISTCKCLQTTSIYHLEDKNMLDNNILGQSKFQNLISLNINLNKNINDISFLTNLTSLNIGSSKSILNQTGITKLSKLIYLNMDYNHNIK